MMHMYKVVNTSDIPDTSTIAIEYQIPLTSKRIDFIISGADENQRSNIVIIELKQWEQAKLSQNPVSYRHVSSTVKVKRHILPTRLGRMPICFKTIMKQYVNRTYNSCLVRFYITIKRIILFLMNAMLNILRKHLFSEVGCRKITRFHKKHIKYASKEDVVWLIDKGKLRPSKQLADALNSMLHGNREFVLLDDQKIVYETALNLAREAAKGSKQVLIVEGGPGTGKSVVAVNLLVELTKEGVVTQYVSKNAAPRAVYTVKLSGSFKKTTSTTCLWAVVVSLILHKILLER